jgi:hypothetical protein
MSSLEDPHAATALAPMNPPVGLRPGERRVDIALSETRDDTLAVDPDPIRNEAQRR